MMRATSVYRATPRGIGRVGDVRHLLDGVAPSLGLAALAMLGCGDATGPITAESVTGSYALVTIGGRTLPAPITGAVVLNQSLTFAADGRWTATIESRDNTSGSTSSGTNAGTWVLDGARRTIVVTTSGSRTSTTLTYTIALGGRVLGLGTPDGEWRYERRP